MQGLFVALLGLPLMFGTFAAVIVGAMYGPFAFLGIFGLIIGGLSFYVDRKVGRSLQFAEYNFFKRTFAQVVAFLVAAGIILFFVFLSHLRLF